MKSAIYPGSFDPITNGHLDIIERAMKIFDKIIVAVGDNPQKKPLFTINERIDILKRVTKKNKNVEIGQFNGLLLDYVKTKKSNIIIRGLRAVSDFESEFQRALLNRKITEDIETVFIMTKDEYSFLSASIVKEMAMFGGDVKGLVPDIVEKKLKEKFKQQNSTHLG